MPILDADLLCLHANLISRQVSSCSRPCHVQVNKRRGEKYQLIWKDKPDFVRMAAKSNALIIPFAAVGGDDAYDIAMDTDEVLANPLLGPLARTVTSRVFRGTPLEGSDDAVSPITKLPGLGVPSLLPLPKLERLYFRLPAARVTQICMVQLFNALPWRFRLNFSHLGHIDFAAYFWGRSQRQVCMCLIRSAFDEQVRLLLVPHWVWCMILLTI